MFFRLVFAIPKYILKTDFFVICNKTGFDFGIFVFNTRIPVLLPIFLTAQNGFFFLLN